MEVMTCCDSLHMGKNDQYIGYPKTRNLLEFTMTTEEVNLESSVFRMTHMGPQKLPIWWLTIFGGTLLSAKPEKTTDPKRQDPILNQHSFEPLQGAENWQFQFEDLESPEVCRNVYLGMFKYSEKKKKKHNEN